MTSRISQGYNQEPHRSLRLSLIVEYLRSSGWDERLGSGPLGSTWVRWNAIAGEEYEILLPNRMDVDDYEYRISDALDTLSKVEGRPIVEIVRNIKGSVDSLIAQAAPRRRKMFELLWQRLRGERATVAQAPGRDSFSVQPGARQSPFVVGTPILHDQDFVGRRQQIALLRDAIADRQPVQILGERRMGKSSLLRWVERHVGVWVGSPVAWVNAQGLASHSPEHLVREAARSLGRSPEVAEALRREHVSQALRRLLPMVLLVDEAEALAPAGHGFEDGFFEDLRSLGQDGRLRWISAAGQDLFGLFNATGLTSRFLNDARRVWVGQLEDEAAQELAERGGDEERAAMVLAEAGGFALGLQALGDALWRATGDSEAACDAWASEMESCFAIWWSACGRRERSLLAGCATTLERSRLATGERRRVRALAVRGLVREEAGRFLLPGDAWRRFVAEK